MGSRLSKLSGPPPKKDPRQQDFNPDDIFTLDEPEAAPASHASAMSTSQSLLHNHGDNAPPTKRRTSPRVAELRKMLRGKLMATPD
jgi:hypothetical protein